MAATARTATAKAGTRSLVHRAPAPALSGTAPRGRVDSLVGTPAVMADVPAVHPVSRRPRTPGHTGATPDTAVGTPVEPSAEEGPSTVPAAPRRVPVVAPRPATGLGSSASPGAGQDPGTAPLPLTRATDAYVGEPRPVTPPPARSEFDLQLDAFRPAWIVAQLENAGGDLPSYVLARREKGPQPAAAPDPQPFLPPTPAAVLPPAVPGAPRASLAESRRRDLAHRSRRRPDTYRRQSADGTVQEDDTAPLATAAASGALETPVDPAVPETPAMDEAPEALVSGEVPVPSGTRSAPDAGTDTSVPASPGWEAEWSRKQAARHGSQRLPRDAAPRASEPAAETPASGHTGRGLPSGPAPSAAPESDAPTEDDTASTPTPAPTTVPVLFDGAAGSRDARDPFRPSVATDDAREAAVPSSPAPSSPALPELAHRAAPRPAADPEPPGTAATPPTSQDAPSTGEASSEPTTANGASPSPAPAPTPEGTMPSGTGTATDLARAPGGTPSWPRPSTPTAAGHSGAVASADPASSVAPPAPGAPVTARDTWDAVVSPLPGETTGEPEAALPSEPNSAADSMTGPTQEPEAAPSSVPDPVASTAADSMTGPMPTATPASAITVVPRAVPSSVAPGSFRTAEAPDADRPRTAYRIPPTHPTPPLPEALRPEPTRSSREGHPLLVHRHPSSGANVLILEQVPEPALPSAAPDPAVGVALPLTTTPATSPGIPTALAAAPRTGPARLESADTTTEGAAAQAADHGTEPPRDATGASLLRLVPSLSPTDGPAAAAPVAAGAVRTHPVLYAVPQYVAPLFAAARPAVGLLSGPATPNGTEPWAPDTDEPEAVSAEAMALAIHRVAVGSDLVPVADAPSLPGPGAQARAATRWFGDTASLHHVRVRPPQDTVTAGTLVEGSDGRVPSASVAPPEASAVPPYEESGGGEWMEQPSVTYPAGGGHLPPPGGGGFSFGGPPPSGPARDPGVPLERTPEWAALLDMLADRDRIYARFDDPAVLDALAARLYDRILAHVRQELVVERERHGLLAPRS
ncbi:hypothetical protein ACFT8P_28345 [Streptomyces sp. NPDC057101]|uniref:hypothetical protein n=1 Tax=Streptomyces sp. NPDC057101 TaxID=3346020 RepID=UPI00363502A9